MAGVGMVYRQQRAQKKHALQSMLFALTSYILELSPFYIHCIQAFSALLNIEANFVVFTNVINKTGNVHKNIGATVSWGNEAKPFGLIEKFNCSFLHFFIVCGK
ncbi:hypothetical protein BLX24_06105 [Arsenicibacter rosenii]|uniref:Uncharacterized protein n=1 Tax=Arsenicibacter rosenii TaxID=1750698 RepID=A0A1S2VQA3_9BACT|nr:hypothetical protein BLX24_06105 [Arsenicibacter rosenii]